MTWIRQRVALLRKISAAALIAIGAGVFVLWHCWVMPDARRGDHRWAHRFTTDGYWEYVQQHIRRYGWGHDDFGDVGMWGGKDWAIWIMARAEAGQNISDCGRIGHKDEALKWITCQDPSGGKPWGTEGDWIGWWRSNHSKSQIEWIRDGLASYGAPVHIPPSDADRPDLLALLGNTETNEPTALPHFVKYNAFRWLRDSGFDPVAFALSNAAESTPADVIRGLSEFRRHYEWAPRRNTPGALPLLPSTEPELERPRPAALYFETRATAYALMIIPTAAGIFLLRSKKDATSGCAGSTSGGTSDSDAH